MRAVLQNCMQQCAMIVLLYNAIELSSNNMAFHRIQVPGTASTVKATTICANRLTCKFL